MKKVITSPEQLATEKKNTTYVFLAGPIQDAPNWQNTLPDLPGITWINPRRNVIDRNSFSWNEQVEWETMAIRISDFILFWIPLPENTKNLTNDRDYAQTTRMELLENLARRKGKNIILGIENGIHGYRYMEYKYKYYSELNICHSLEECIDKLKVMIKTREDNDNVFFTSDTHFGSTRALELSKRPFHSVTEMDLTMIEKWNMKVPPNAKVYHLGDFGDYSMIKYLNGNITLVLGNYERDERKSLNLDYLDYETFLVNKGFDNIKYSEVEETIGDENWKLIMGHEPRNVKNQLDSVQDNQQNNKWFGLFGHIHGRQKIKSWGIDVGVDSTNFEPMTGKEVMFYLNAIDKGYYDQEVFCV